MLLQFTFDIFYSHRLMSNSFIYFTVAMPVGVSRRALRCGTGARARPCGAAVQPDVFPGPRQRQVPRSPPRGTELSGALAGETGACVTPR